MVDITIPTVHIRKLRHRESQSTPTPERGVCWPQLGRGHEATYLGTWVTSFSQPPSRPSMALTAGPEDRGGSHPTSMVAPAAQCHKILSGLIGSLPPAPAPVSQAHGIRPLLSQGQPLQDLNPPCPPKGGTQDLLSLSSFTLLPAKRLQTHFWPYNLISQASLSASVKWGLS